jgi:hypothetical protein
VCVCVCACVCVCVCITQVMTVAPMYFRYDGVQTTGKWKEFQVL